MSIINKISELSFNEFITFIQHLSYYRQTPEGYDYIIINNVIYVPIIGNSIYTYKNYTYTETQLTYKDLIILIFKYYDINRIEQYIFENII